MKHLRPGPLCEAGTAALAFAAVLACLGVAIAAAYLGFRRLDGHWDWLAVTSVTGMALVSVGLIRLILSAVDNWMERAAERARKPGSQR